MRALTAICLILISGCSQTRTIPVPKPVIVEVEVPQKIPPHLLEPCELPNKPRTYREALEALNFAIASLRACNADKAAIAAQ